MIKKYKNNKKIKEYKNIKIRKLRVQSKLIIKSTNILFFASDYEE